MNSDFYGLLPFTALRALRKGPVSIDLYVFSNTYSAKKLAYTGKNIKSAILFR